MDVISLVSSDEEDDGILKRKKNITVKKVKTPKKPHNEIPMQKISTPQTAQQPQYKSNVTVIRAIKPVVGLQQTITSLQKTPTSILKSGVNTQNQNKQSAQKTVNFSSGITITPLKDGSSNSRSTLANSNAITNSIKSKLKSSVTIVRQPAPIQATMKPSVGNSASITVPPPTKLVVSLPNTIRAMAPKVITVKQTSNAKPPSPTVGKMTVINSTAIKPAMVNQKKINPAALSRLGTSTTVTKSTIGNVTVIPTVAIEPLVVDPLTISPRVNQPAPSPSVPSSSAPSPPTISPRANASCAAKRIAPTKISDKVTMRSSSIEKSSDSDVLSRDSSMLTNDEIPPNTVSNGTADAPIAKRSRLDDKQSTPNNGNHLDELIDEMKKSNENDDMKKVIAKLEKYYRRAHPNFVNSKSFMKLVIKVTNEIKAQPDLVYIKLNILLEELKTRRTMDSTSAEETEKAPVDEKKAKKILLLSTALRKLQQKIRQCEEAEVDWDDELNSKYLLTERYKKRACAIYEKLCDLTGESRSAERIIKKPIKFHGTSYSEFNRKLEKFINETKLFPDMFDVLRIVDYCNKNYDYRLNAERRKTLAQDAFFQVGTLLQKRRKADLYEMVQYFTANQSDPAGEDTTLKTKLEENRKHYSKRMNDVLEKFSMRHGGIDSEANEDQDSPGKSKSVDENITNRPTVPNTSVHSRTSPDAVPTIEKPELKIDLDAVADDDDDMLIHNDSIFITDYNPSDFNDQSGILDDMEVLDKDDMQELNKEFYPTIKSVASLHPSKFNELLNLNMSFSESSQIESGNHL